MREQIKFLIQELINQCIGRLSVLEGEIDNMFEDFEQRFLRNEIHENESLVIPDALLTRQTSLLELLHLIYTTREEYVNKMNQILLNVPENRTETLRVLLIDLQLDYQDILNRIQEI